MALCIDCGTALPSSAKDCPACGARREWSGAGGAAAAVSAASLPAIESEMMIAEVRLVTAPGPSEGCLGHRGAAFAADAATVSPRPTVRSWVADNDLALCAFVLGVVSVVFGLLGQGWFGIVAVGCAHQARRRMADDGAGRAGSILAITGLVLGSAAILMTLGSLVVNRPWS